MTVRDLIESSLRLIGAIATGETPSAAEESEALLALNGLLEAWSTQGLMIYQSPRLVFPLVGGQQMYTMGVGGNFNTARPMQILNASILQNTADPANEVPIRILETTDEWAEIPLKNTNSSFPTKLYVEWDNPLAKLYVWPIPFEASSLVLYTHQPFTAFPDAATTVALPPGYARSLRYNLALELAPEYGKEPSALVLRTAEDTKADIMRGNIRPDFMESDAFGLAKGGSHFNYRTGK